MALGLIGFDFFAIIYAVAGIIKSHATAWKAWLYMPVANLILLSAMFSLWEELCYIRDSTARSRGVKVKAAANRANQTAEATSTTTTQPSTTKVLPVVSKV